MGLFNRASRHSSRDESSNGSVAESSTRLDDAEIGAELAELGERVPESEPAEPEASEPPVSDESVADGAPEPPVTSSTESTEEPVEDKTTEPAAQKTSEPEAAAPEPEPEDPDAGRISFDEALSPRRSAVTGVESPAAGTDEKAVGSAKVISFANQKGGVAKTTSTLNLAVAFAESGYRVLAIDLDPQGNLTMSQGIDPDKVEKSMYDVLVHHIPLTDVIQKREIDIAVASIDLAGAEIAMSTQIGRERSLEKAIKGVASDYDFICIDTPPSLGLLTVNALTASDRVIVPVQCEYLSMRGLMQLKNTLEMIKENLNPRVQIEGILPTMLDSRTVHAKEAVEILEENFGELVFKSRIRKAIKFAEAPVRGASVLKYDPKSNAADYYRELAKEVLTHGAT
jgi:chromosome partitioning protein